MNQRALAAEFIGTFTLVAATCGSALFSALSGGGLVAVAFAIGLSVLIMAYAVGHISGGHFNPAVTLGLVAGGRFDMANAVPYIIAQVAGGIVAALIFSMILRAHPRHRRRRQVEHLRGDLQLVRRNGQVHVDGRLPDRGRPHRAAADCHHGRDIEARTRGLCADRHRRRNCNLPSRVDPVSNTSLNPARSTAPALLAGGAESGNLWLFWVAPIIGAVIGGTFSKWVQNE